MNIQKVSYTGNSKSSQSFKGLHVLVLMGHLKNYFSAEILLYV